MSYENTKARTIETSSNTGLIREQMLFLSFEGLLLTQTRKDVHRDGNQWAQAADITAFLTCYYRQSLSVTRNSN